MKRRDTLDEHGHVVVVELAKGGGLVGPEPQLADGTAPRGSSAKWDGHKMGFYFLVGWVGPSVPGAPRPEGVWSQSLEPHANTRPSSARAGAGLPQQGPFIWQGASVTPTIQGWGMFEYIGNFKRHQNGKLLC